MIKIAIIEINAVYRRKLAYFLENCEGVQLIHALPNCNNLGKAFAEKLPDVVVMSIDYPGIKRIKNSWPSVKIIVLTIFNKATDIFTSISAGADGYLLKSASGKKIIQSILIAQSGGQPLSKEVVSKIKAVFRFFLTNKKKPDRQALSNRESQVLALMRQGYSVQAIANKCQCSPQLIKSLIKCLYIKLYNPKN